MLEVEWTKHYWYVVQREQRHFLMSFNVEDVPGQQKSISFQLSSVLGLRIPTVYSRMDLPIFST